MENTIDTQRCEDRQAHLREPLVSECPTGLGMNATNP